MWRKLLGGTPCSRRRRLFFFDFLIERQHRQHGAFMVMDTDMPLERGCGEKQVRM